MTKTKPTAPPARIEIIYQPIAELVEYTQNAKVHPPSQINDLTKSIKQNGFIQPVVVTSDGEIIIGHARAMAAAAAGHVEVPTVRVEHLSPTQIRALRLFDNKIAESGFWHGEMLADEVAGLAAAAEAAGEDFAALLSGFDPAEVLGADAPDEINMISEREPKPAAALTQCPACGHRWPKKQ